MLMKKAVKSHCKRYGDKKDEDFHSFRKQSVTDKEYQIEV
jgi:hypothetical protein